MARVGKTTVAAASASRRLRPVCGHCRDRRPGPASRHRPGPRRGAMSLSPMLTWRTCGSPCSTPGPRGGRWRSDAAPDVAERLARNEFFLAAAEHFPASQAYAAADQAATYAQARRGPVVVDTPPSGGGIDFFTAPAQMADLVGGRLLRWITGGLLSGAASSTNARPGPSSASPTRCLARPPGKGHRVPPADLRTTSRRCGATRTRDRASPQGRIDPRRDHDQPRPAP